MQTNPPILINSTNNNNQTHRRKQHKHNTMVSLRFPFSFSHSTTTTKFPSPSTLACSVAVSAAVGGAISSIISISHNSNAFNSFVSNLSRSSPLWGSISLSDGPDSVVTEWKTGVSFPAVLNNAQGLLGIGLRRKAVFGLKNIDVYAFGNLILLILFLVTNVVRLIIKYLVLCVHRKCKILISSFFFLNQNIKVIYVDIEKLEGKRLNGQ